MAAPTTESTNFPDISLTVWQTLRKKFQENPPRAGVTRSYLSNVLKYQDKPANALIGKLRRVGLIDSEGKLTPLAFRWRDDAQYKASCEEILDAVYPSELRDLYPGPDSSRAGIESWFANTTKRGTGTAANYARFYMLLLEGDPTKLDAPPPSKATGANTSNAKRSTSNNSKASSQQSGRTSAHEKGTNGSRPHEEEPARPTHRENMGGVFPALHLDFQIHISPDSPPELIDKIFESMAKHLRTLASGAAE